MKVFLEVLKDYHFLFLTWKTTHSNERQLLPYLELLLDIRLRGIDPLYVYHVKIQFNFWRKKSDTEKSSVYLNQVKLLCHYIHFLSLLELFHRTFAETSYHVFHLGRHGICQVSSVVWKSFIHPESSPFQCYSISLCVLRDDP